MDLFKEKLSLRTDFSYFLLHENTKSACKTQKTSLVFCSSAPDPDLMNCLSLKKGLNHCILNVCACELNMSHALLRGRGDESLCAPCCHPNLTRHHDHQRGNRHAGQVCRVPELLGVQVYGRLHQLQGEQDVWGHPQQDIDERKCTASYLFCIFPWNLIDSYQPVMKCTEA